jgi:hypothetical protein
MTTEIVLSLIAALIAYRLFDLHLGGHYVCPRCGATKADAHAGDCPWRH